MNRDGVSVRAAHHQQDDKARQLRNCRRNRCARNAHVEHENQQRVKEHIQHAAGDDADHAVRRQSLEAQEVVHRQRTHHERRGKEDIPRIVQRIRHSGLRRTEQAHQRLIEHIAQYRNQHARRYCGKEADRAVHFRLLALAHAQQVADVRAAAHAEHERQRLNHRHCGKDDADGGGGGCAACTGFRRANLADEIGVRHIINGGNQH